MSVEELQFAIKEGGSLKIEFKNNELNFIDSNFGAPYVLVLDRNEAHLLMLWLQEHLK